VKIAGLQVDAKEFVCHSKSSRYKLYLSYILVCCWYSNG